MIKRKVKTLLSRTKRAIRTTGLSSADRFVLLCHQRSGSNMMTSVLNQHPQVIMRGQLYKDDPDYQRELQTIGTVPFIGRHFDDEIEERLRFDRLQADKAAREPRNAREVAESFYKGQSASTTARTVGIKFHGGTLYDDEVEDIFFDNIPYDFILLRRENLVAAGISWCQARALNQWVAREPGDVKKPKMTIDIEELKGFVYRTKDDIDQWKQMLSKHGKDYLELTYEQITDPNFDYDLIWKHLGVKNISRPGEKTLKLIKDYEHLTNLEEIRSEFKGKGVGMI